MSKVGFQILALLCGLILSAFLVRFLTFAPTMKYIAAIVAGTVAGGAIGSTLSQMLPLEKFEKNYSTALYFLYAAVGAGIGAFLSPKLFTMIVL
jgi:uncharacterized membrane protein YeaQ/YmgE (transglycosylase-associated protein family)